VAAKLEEMDKFEWSTCDVNVQTVSVWGEGWGKRIRTSSKSEKRIHKSLGGKYHRWRGDPGEEYRLMGRKKEMVVLQLRNKIRISSQRGGGGRGGRVGPGGGVTRCKKKGQ